MRKNGVECLNCGGLDYKTKEYMETIDERAVGGDCFEFKQIGSFCTNCGALIDSGNGLERYRRRNEAIKKHYGLVGSEQLLEMTRKYDISKHNLEIVMELPEYNRRWGREDVWNGAGLDSDNGERVLKALNDPAFYLKYLKKHHSEIPLERLKASRRAAYKLTK